MSKLHLGSIVLIVSFLTGIFFFSKDKQAADHDVESVLEITRESDCLRKNSTCLVQLDEDLSIRVQTIPQIIKPLERFKVKLSFLSNDNSDISDLVLWVEGRDMDMGRHLLQQSTAKSGALKGFEFGGMIPICTLDENMIWRMVLHFSHKGSPFRLKLDLSTEVHGA